MGSIEITPKDLNILTQAARRLEAESPQLDLPEITRRLHRAYIKDMNLDELCDAASKGMGSLDVRANRYFAGPLYAEAEKILAEYGGRTDLDRVFVSSGNFIHIASQTDDHSLAPHGDIVEIHGTRGVAVSLVIDTYREMAAYIMPDDHVSVPWGAIAGLKDKPKMVWLD